MLIRLIYASTPRENVDLNACHLLLEKARLKNKQLDITGMLVFDGKFFMQGLEGKQAHIDDLYAKLLRDPRHHSVQLLSCREISTREWSNWTMGFAMPTPENEALFLKYSWQNFFNPYDLKPIAAEKLLVELANSIVQDKLASTGQGKVTQNLQHFGFFRRIFTWLSNK
jgi:hypothetical protein